MVKPHVIKINCKTEATIYSDDAFEMSYSEIDDSFRFEIFSSVKDLSFNWDEIIGDHDIFLKKDYLSILEQSPPDGMNFFYILFYKNAIPFGMAYCQLIDFRGNKSIQSLQSESEQCKVKGQLKKWIASQLDVKSLVCGNLLLTGEHGFFFKPGILNKEDQFKLLERAMNSIVSDFAKTYDSIDAILIKEFYENGHEEKQAFTSKGYNEFQVLPNMILDLPDSWKKFDDYLQALSSKYRVRAKRAFKKSKQIEKRTLDVEDIKNHSSRLHCLYLEIADEADFNLVRLHPDYWVALKETFPDKFELKGYFFKDQLIGFLTTFKNKDQLVAHFIGFKKEIQRKFQLYLNILYDIIELGIQNNVRKVIFARTAMEIKSSVGAVDIPMYCYLRHRQPVTNKLVIPLVNYFQTEKNWQARHPFK